MTLKGISGVNILALIFAIPMFLEGTFSRVIVHSLESSSKTLAACVVRDYSEEENYRTYYSIYSVLRALLINIGPCTVLVILNTILVKRMSEAKQNRKRLIQNRQQDNRTSDQSSVTRMLVSLFTNHNQTCHALSTDPFFYVLDHCCHHISHR